jgi:hypothetical protein
MENAKGEADKVRAYLAAMRLAIQDIAIYPRKYYIFDVVTFGLLSKVFSLADAIAALVENQHPEEGFGLVRTLVECTLNLRYLTRDRPEWEARAYRFSKFYFTEQGHWLHAMLEYYKDDSAMIAKLKANARKQRITADPERVTHWSGDEKFSTYKVATEEHPLDGKLWTLRQRKADYESGYFRTSAYVHGSHEAVDRFYPDDDNAAFVPRLHSDGATREARAACWMVVRYVHQAVRYTLFGAQILDMDAIDKVFRETIAAIDR